MALTELGIRKLKRPKPGKRREKYDREIRGFGIRVTDRGVRSYILLYSFGGRRRRYTIGRIGEIGIEEAREEARRLRGVIRQGRDPAAEEKAARAIAKTASAPKTFGEVVELYEKRALAGKRSGRQARMTIDRHLMPSWKGIPLSSITRADVLERIEALVDAGTVEAARGVFNICRRLFNWAVSRGAFGIAYSPCEKLRPADIAAALKDRSIRERILTDREWRALFRAVRSLGYPYEPIIELLALTGLRRNEVVQALWSEFDLVNRKWSIPSQRMKGDRPHVVPLTPRMIEIVSSLPHNNKFLFPNDRGDRPFSSFSLFKERIDRRMAEELQREDPAAELENWRFHDLRRSMRTKLSELPVPGGDLVRELLLAHAKPALHQVYDQAAYLNERRRAYELWQEKLTGILEGRSADVIQLTAQRADRLILGGEERM
jgi:integrase